MTCHNGGVCQAVRNNQYHAKCVCPKDRAGLFCQKPNLCLDNCLNGGKCYWTREGSVSCVCRAGFGGPRCEHKATGPPLGIGDNDDTKEVNSTIVSILSILTSILVVVGLAGGLFLLYRKKRLGSAFKHRRMAENLIGNQMEFPNQMFSLTEDDVNGGGSGIPMSDSVNFANPVYETIYGDPDRPILRTAEAGRDRGGSAIAASESEGLLTDADRIDTQSLNNEAVVPEAVDLLTERHRGNIDL